MPAKASKLTEFSHGAGCDCKIPPNARETRLGPSRGVTSGQPEAGTTSPRIGVF